MRLSIVFVIMLSTIHLSGRGKENPFMELGNYIYTLAQPLNCGFHEAFFTLTSSVAEENKIQKLHVTDTIHKASLNGFSMGFNRRGLLTSFRDWQNEFFFEYDSVLMSQRIIRVSRATRNEWSDGQRVYSYERRFLYDDFGNPIYFTEEGGPACYCRYKNTIHYQFVFLTESSGSDTIIQSYKYDKKSGELFWKWEKRKYELVGTISLDNNEFLPDTLKSAGRYFNCVDLIPDGRYESVPRYPEDTVFIPIIRDSLGRFIEIRYKGGLRKKVSYSNSGLPESVTNYWVDGETVINSFTFRYEFY